jgi:hypothetical protein
MSVPSSLGWQSGTDSSNFLDRSIRDLLGLSAVPCFGSLPTRMFLVRMLLGAAHRSSPTHRGLDALGRVETAALKPWNLGLGRGVCPGKRVP